MFSTARTAMRGFTLLESLIALAILAVTALGLTSAVLAGTHAVTLLLSRAELTDVASGVMTDLRAAAAYQPEVLGRLAAASPVHFVIMRSGDAADAATAPVAIGVDEIIERASVPDAYDVRIVATAPDGRSEALQQRVMRQAVAPGSDVTPAPGPAGANDSR